MPCINSPRSSTSANASRSSIGSGPRLAITRKTDATTLAVRGSTSPLISPSNNHQPMARMSRSREGRMAEGPAATVATAEGRVALTAGKCFEQRAASTVQ